MNEKQKLSEAAFSLGKMRSEMEMPYFGFYLSAFISAARCVQQYALEEAKQKNGGQHWYETQVTQEPVLKFFREKRNINIHLKPLVLHQTVILTEKVTLGISESVHIKMTNSDGVVEQSWEMTSSPSYATVNQESHSTVEQKYRIDDWADPEDAGALCQQYLLKLDNFIQSGILSAFVSG